MKKEIKLWKLWWMFIIHFLAIIGVSGLYINYIVPIEMSNTLHIVAAIIVAALTCIFMVNFILLLIRILKHINYLN